jgi:uncharacterized RDD family membrane protein YckC
MATSSRSLGEKVTYTRRFFGDSWVESLLQQFTLWIGWLIWFAIVAPKGQTPAKQLLSVYILNYETGEIASTGQVWMREFVGKAVLSIAVGIVGIILTEDFSGIYLGYIYYLFAALWIFFDQDRRALWDHLAKTEVMYAPNLQRRQREAGPEQTGSVEQRLSYLNSLREQGTITGEEYAVKRQEIISKL